MTLAFTALIAATWYTVKIAMAGHEPVMDKNYYEKGMNYEKEIAQTVQMRSEGYHFRTTLLEKDSEVTLGNNQLSIGIFKNEEPVKGAKLVLTRERSATNKFTEKKEFIYDKDGMYKANVDFPLDGPWQVTLNASVDGRSFEKTFMIVVK